MSQTEQIRQWLKVVLGPTAKVDAYSDAYIHLRFRNMCGFYGAQIMSNWGAPVI